VSEAREHQRLETYLAAHARPEVGSVIAAIAGVAIQLSEFIARGPLVAPAGNSTTRNASGDDQKSLDVFADRAFAEAMTKAGVRWFASEEREAAEELDPKGKIALAIDPLDGSSNIDVNISIGTIFSILPTADTAAASFLRFGRDQLAAGYVIYGPQTALVFTLDAGVAHFVLDRTAGDFVLASDALAISEGAQEFAINASNYRHWPAPIRSYIDDCLAGETGPRGRNFNMRWVASLVAETHRIIMRGGIFLYPGDARRGYEHGRLRMLYECAPIALLIERAGGAATDGSDRILDQAPRELHARTPFVFGSADKVARVAAYYDLPPTEVAPLFGKRGLFRA